MTKRAIDYRPPDLIVAILNLALDDDDPKHEIPEAELVELLSAGEWKAETVRRAARELVDFGAVVRVTTKKDPEPRYRLSTLGRAWVDRRLERFVKGQDGDDQGEHDDDEETLDLD